MNAIDPRITDAIASAHAVLQLVVDRLDVNADLPADQVATIQAALTLASQCLDAVWEAIAGAGQHCAAGRTRA